MTLDRRILSMAGRTTGVSLAELKPWAGSAVSLRRLHRNGHLHRTPAGQPARYFFHPGLRDAWADAWRLREQSARKEPGSDDLVVSWTPDTPATETENTVYTACPSFCAPDFVEQTFSYGGNQRGRVLRARLG